MLARGGHVTVPRGPAQEAGRIQQAVDEGRRFAEERELLLEVNVDAAEKDRDVFRPGRRGLVEDQRQIHRRDRHVVAGAMEFAGKRVVAHARAAVVAAGAGRKEDDFHGVQRG